METYLVPMWVVECGVQRDGCISMVKAADAQATVEALQAQLEAAERHNTILQDANKVALEKVEALQAEKLMLERGVSAQSALIDGLQSQLIQRTAALEAVQHERDEANSHVKFLGATKQANGSFCLDMKKYHARYRCGRHRDDPWKGIDTEIDCFVCLKHDLDAEREKVKGLHEVTRVICTHCCEPMEIPSKAVLQTQLTQLQALVRALPVVDLDTDYSQPGSVEVFEEVGSGWMVHTYPTTVYWSKFRVEAEAMAYAKLLAYRATLDATTPAQTDEQRCIEACCERPHDCKWGGTGGCGYEGRKPKGGDGE